MVAKTASVESIPLGLNLLLVEHRRLVREGLIRLLEETDEVGSLVAVTGWEQAIQAVKTAPVDIVLVGGQASAVGLLGGVGKFSRYARSARLILMTSARDLVIQHRLLQAGIAGCIDDQGSLFDLLSAIDTVHRGERFISDHLARALAASRSVTGGEVAFDELNHRELQVWLLVAEGGNVGEIAHTLCLTRKTVHTYRNRLFAKLGVDSDVRLARLAIRYGLVEVAHYE